MNQLSEWWRPTWLVRGKYVKHGVRIALAEYEWKTDWWGIP